MADRSRWEFVETKEHLGHLAVVDVPDEGRARYWAGRTAVAIGWPQVHHSRTTSRSARRTGPDEPVRRGRLA